MLGTSVDICILLLRQPCLNTTMMQMEQESLAQLEYLLNSELSEIQERIKNHTTGRACVCLHFLCFGEGNNDCANVKVLSTHETRYITQSDNRDKTIVSFLNLSTSNTYI